MIKLLFTIRTISLSICLLYNPRLLPINPMINKLSNKMHYKPVTPSPGLTILQEALDTYNRLLLKEESCKIELDHC